MSNTKRISLSACCFLEVTQWDIFKSEASLCYIEHSSDSYYSDRETEVYIQPEKAREIIEVLYWFIEPTSPSTLDCLSEKLRCFSDKMPPDKTPNLTASDITKAKGE